MAADPLTLISTRRTPQSEQADPRQIQNSAGGYTFTLDDAARLRRFLVIGSAGGTYYVGQDALTKDNVQVVIRMAKERPLDLVDAILDVSLAGKAPRQNPTLFALAIAASLADVEGRRAALAAIPAVCRTGTHLLQFVKYVEQFRGWGRGLRNAVATWYTYPTVDALAYQLVKYRQREGWSQRDVLRMAHPKTTDPARKALFDWACRGWRDDHSLPFLAGSVVEGFEAVQDDPGMAFSLIPDYPLSWEMLPDAALTSPLTWEALLDKGIPQTALMRQLPRLTRLGLLPPMGKRTAQVAARLSDPERLLKARVHPISVLLALRTYAAGRSARGDGEWEPTREIVDALDAAFYASFKAVEPTGKRTMLALDVSGSMGAPISNLPLSCREASAALALVLASTETSYQIVGFTAAVAPSRRPAGHWGMPAAALTPLAISPRQRMDDVLRVVSNLPFGGTDCSLPMRHALDHGIEVDTFVILTDNETWAGPVHPHQALRQYRERTGIPAKLIVVGMTATAFSIADPTDPGMLDIAGFDASVPTVVSDFSRGL